MLVIKYSDIESETEAKINANITINTSFSYFINTSNYRMFLAINVNVWSFRTSACLFTTSNCFLAVE
jgi:hypothetical protein